MTTALRRGTRTVLALLAGLSAIGTAACGHSSEAAVPKPVTIHVGDSAGGTKALMDGAKAMAGAGYTVSFDKFQSAVPIFEAMRAGAVDVSTVGDASVLNALVKQTPLKIVGVSQDSPKALALLVPKGSTAKSVADLKGKKVAYVQNSVAHVMVLGLLKKAGLGIGDIQSVDLAPLDASSALAGGSVDAWAVWDPYLSLAESKGSRILATAEGINPSLGFTVATDAALADPAKRAAIADYVKRLGNAYQWALDNPSGYVKVFAGLTGMPTEVAQLVQSRGTSKPLTVDDTVIQKFQDLADTCAANNIIPGKVAVQPYFQPLT